MPFNLIIGVSGDLAWTMAVRLCRPAPRRKRAPPPPFSRLLAGEARVGKRGATEWLVWRDRGSVLRFAGYAGRDEHGYFQRTSSRTTCRCRRCLLDHSGARVFAFPQRHDAVAAAGALSDAKGHLWAQLRPDRDDHADLAADLVGHATGGRALCRPSPATLLARRRHGCHVHRPVAAGERWQLPDAGLRGGIGRCR